MDNLLRSFLCDAFIGTRFDCGIVAIHDSLSLGFAGALSTAVAEKAVMDAPEPENCFEPQRCKDLRERVYKDAVRSARKDEL